MHDGHSKDRKSWVTMFNVMAINQMHILSIECLCSSGSHIGKSLARESSGRQDASTGVNKYGGLKMN